MFKLPAISAAVIVLAAQGASACVAYDGPTDTFTNTCGNEVFVQYRTVGGGCYATEHGSVTLKDGESKSDPLLSETCGSSGTFRVDWAWCDYQDWKSGSCKPKF